MAEQGKLTILRSCRAERRRADRGPSPARRWPVSALALAAVSCLLLCGAGCRKAPAAKENGGLAQAMATSAIMEDPGAISRLELFYRPEWMSPNGRYLVFGGPGSLTDGVLLDLTDGREVLRVPQRLNVFAGVGWSGASDAVCWSQFDVKSQKPLVPSRAHPLRYCLVPAGRPVDLIDTNTLPDAQGSGCLCSPCFVGPHTIALGVQAYGHYPAGPGGGTAYGTTLYYELSIGQDGSGAKVTSVVQGPAAPGGGGTVMHLLPISGQRVLASCYTLEGVRDAGLFVVDLSRRTVTQVASGKTRCVAKYMPPVYGVPASLGDADITVLDPGHKWLVSRPYGPSAIDRCEIWVLTAGKTFSLKHLGTVKGGLRFPVVLPDGKGFVLPKFVPGKEARALDRLVPATNLYLLNTKLKVVRQLTKGATFDDYPLWSQATGRIIFRRDKSEIWSVSLKGGDARRVWPARAAAKRAAG